jgi:hypothetical protein
LFANLLRRAPVTEERQLDPTYRVVRSHEEAKDYVPTGDQVPAEGATP